MHLSIDSLKEAGAFTGAPIEKEITWKQGDKELTATVYVRPLSYSTAVSDLLAMNGKVDGVAGRIAASIVDERGGRCSHRQISPARPTPVAALWMET